MARPSERPLDACPFLEDEDPRCDGQVTLGRLGDAMHTCLGGYRGCPVYWRLMRERPPQPLPARPHARPVRATGP